MSRMSHSLPVMARLYRLAVRLLPAHVRRQDGDEMVLAFLDLWLESRGVASRSALVLKLFSGLVVVACAEWADVLGLTRWNARGVGLMGLGRNLRFVLRTLRKAPAFTFTTILLIGLGVGSVTTIFTLVDHVLLRPLPYPQAERLITVEEGSHSAILFRGFDSSIRSRRGPPVTRRMPTSLEMVIRCASSRRSCRAASSRSSVAARSSVDCWSRTTSPPPTR